METTSDENTLGGRLPLLRAGPMSRADKQLNEMMAADLLPWAEKSGFKYETADGRPIGPFNPLRYSPEVGQAFVAYSAAERKNTALSAEVREVVILTVGAVWQSAYELYAHTAVATKAGLPAATISALAAGRTPDDLPSDQRAAHAFVRQLTAERRVDESTYRLAVDQFGEKGVVDMVHLAALYMGTSALLNAFAVPVPAES